MKTSSARFCLGLPAALLLSALLAGCGSAFGDAQSTKGPALTVVPGVGRATLSWRPAVGAESYRLEWSTDAVFPSASTTAVAPANSPTVFDGLDPGKIHHYRIQTVLHSGATSWSEAESAVTGWTWSPPGVDRGTKEFTDTRTFTLSGGGTFDVTTTYEKSVSQLETLLFDTDGVTWKTWLRTTTTLKGKTQSTTDDTVLKLRRGTWDANKRWTSFTLTQEQTAGSWAAMATPESHNTTFTGDRTGFTMDGLSPDWSLVP